MKIESCLLVVFACIALFFVAILLPATNEMAAKANAEMFGSVSSNSTAYVPDVITMPEITFSTWGWIIGIVVFVLVVWAIIKNGGAQVLALFVIAVVFFGLFFWVIMYRSGDVSTADVRDENLQIVKVIQPTGDSDTDAQNSRTNETNAGANVKNAGVFSIFLAGGWVTVILIVFGGMLLLLAIRAKTG